MDEIGVAVALDGAGEPVEGLVEGTVGRDLDQCFHDGRRFQEPLGGEAENGTTLRPRREK